MADYWKSNAKKFCDFCKCWIADNKPSVEFHERGKRHKENVVIRLKTIHSDSAKHYKQQKKLDEDFKKMEKAAVQAYMKDVEQNADLTSKMLNEQLGIAKCKESSTSDREKGYNNKEKNKEEKLEEEKKEEKAKNVTFHEWYEALSDEGYTYYWNTNTGESVWDPPEEGYTSLDVQKKWEDKEKQREVKMKAEEDRKKIEAARQKEEEMKMKSEELRAFMERDKMKKRAAAEQKKTKKEETAKSTVVLGPAPRGNPYGSWTTVKISEPKPVDLQLPELKKIDIKVPVLLPSEPVIKYTEKKCISLEAGEGTSGIFFKKRKLNAASKQNMRQRLDND